ncbi:MAG TPA: hypothetical protein VFG14_10865, partial [Chthoniobacteraceae bacterium]|nr:hypothetical protein [Chthoniobacteraceae bacterium]
SLPTKCGIPEWSKDNRSLLFNSFARDPGKGELPLGAYEMTVANGQIRKIGEYGSIEESKPVLQVSSALTRVQPNPEYKFDESGAPLATPLASIPSFMLEGLVLTPGIPNKAFPNAALVSPDGKNAHLAPNASAVLYSSGNALYVRPIARTDLTTYLRMKQVHDQKEAMMVARQMAVAMQMFAADWDDAFPANEGWADNIMPYVKSRSLIGSFNYTFAGGLLKGDPSTTEIGFSQVEGGRAVAYADGHVVWVPDSK